MVVTCHVLRTAFRNKYSVFAKYSNSDVQLMWEAGVYVCLCVCVCEIFNFLTFLMYRMFHDYIATSRGDSQGHSEREVRYERGYSISVVAVLCIGEILR
jgi:hypothetical protein